MLETLATIREVQVVLTFGKGRPRVRSTHSKLEPLAKELFRRAGPGRQPTDLGHRREMPETVFLAKVTQGPQLTLQLHRSHG